MHANGQQVVAWWRIDNVVEFADPPTRAALIPSCNGTGLQHGGATWGRCGRRTTVASGSEGMYALACTCEAVSGTETNPE
jgi:hypothetical protein